jgi:hypothetical protein
VESFVRQRRNLILISFVLLAVRWLDLSLDLDQLNIFGNTLRFRHTESVLWALWVLWAYWLVRYYQAMRGIEQRLIASDFNKRRIALAIATGQRIWRKRALQHARAQPDIDPGNIRRVTPNVVYDRLKPWSIHIATDQFDVLLQSRAAAEVRTIRLPVRSEQKIAGRHMAWINFRAAWYLVAHTARFTDYILPLLIAAAPVVALLWPEHAHALGQGAVG